MIKLAELQRNFISDCLSGKLTNTNSLMSKDIDTREFSAKSLMGIYQSSAIANIIQAMMLTYPVIEKLVGEDFFRASCKKFIRLHCPKSANMDDYGEEFADFLEEFEPAKQLTYLKDVAQLEWLFHLSSLANDSKVTDWSRLSAVPADKALQVKLLLAPTVKLMSSFFPIDKIWQMNQPNSIVNEEIDLALNTSQETFSIVYRSGLKTEIMTVTEGEFTLLLSFNQQHSLANAIETSTRIDSSISIDDVIKKYIELNIICSFKTD